MCPLHCPSDPPGLPWAAAVVGHRAVVGDGDDLQPSHGQPLDGSLQTTAVTVINTQSGREGTELRAKQFCPPSENQPVPMFLTL